jgi:TolB-like protein/Tfp pilus assembly protein PilF
MLAPGGEGGRTLRFGVFELDTRTGELWKHGIKMKLSDQAYCILRALLNSRGDVVTRDQLKNTLWPNRIFVDSDNAINKSVNQIRTVLADSGANPRFIETLSKRGYRFIAPVSGGPASITCGDTSIAVLPFENLTGNPALAYVADGITEALTTGLGALKGVRVISRTSAKASVATGRSLAAIGRDLTVNVVVEGSVMRAGQLRVNARLIDIHSDRVLWRGKYDCEAEELLVTCDLLTDAVAAELNPSAVGREVSQRRPHQAPGAQLAYLKGRYMWNKRTERDLRASIEEFRRALEIDPGLALAHAGLADAHILLGIWGLESSHSAFRAARQAAERAIELDAGLAEAHASLAEVLKDYDFDWPAAEKEFKRAIAINPNCSTAHHFYAQLLVSLSRFEEAAEQIELARRVDPLSAAINAYVPYIYLAARDYQRAVAEGQRAVELEPDSPLARWQLGRAWLFSGDVVRAVEELETASKLASRRTMWQAELSFGRARAGDRLGAEAILREMTRLAQRSYVSPYDLALCCAGLQHTDAALDYLERAYRDRVMRIMAIGDPEFDGVRQESRFVTLLERLRLPSLTCRNSTRTSSS